MRKSFLIIVIAVGLILFSSVAKAESVTILPDISNNVLTGTNAGNKSTFEVKFTLNDVGSPLPTNAIIQAAKVVYTQDGTSTSGGLLRMIDKYSTDVIDSKSLATSGSYETASILTYVRKWFSLPAQNLGLLFQASALNADDTIAIQNLELQLQYSIPDLTPPALSSDVKVEVGTSTAKILVTTDEPTYVNIDYGRTSNYGQKFVTDNVEPSIDHLILLESLTSGSTYHYKVKMKDASSNSSTSTDLTFDTLTDLDPGSGKPVDQSLKAPQELIIDAVYTFGKAQASLSWNPSNEDGIQGYIIYRADDITKTFTEYATLDVKTNTYLDSSVSLGNTYHYYIRSFSNTVISPKSDEKSITFPSQVPDQKPEQPPTLQTFLILLAAASLVLFVVYLFIKIAQKEDERKSKRLRNVLKDPNHYINKP